MADVTKNDVVKAWEKHLGIKNEYKVEEITDNQGEKVYHLVSRNGSVTAAAKSLEALKAGVGTTFVEPAADETVTPEPVEIDNSETPKSENQESKQTADGESRADSKVGKTPGEPTKEEAERLQRGNTVAERSGNDVAGQTTTQKPVETDK